MTDAIVSGPGCLLPSLGVTYGETAIGGGFPDKTLGGVANSAVWRKSAYLGGVFATR